MKDQESVDREGIHEDSLRASRGILYGLVLGTFIWGCIVAFVFCHFAK